MEVGSAASDRQAVEGADGPVYLGTISVGTTVSDEGGAVRSQVETLDAAKFVVEDIAVDAQHGPRVVHAAFKGIDGLGSHQSALNCIKLRENVAPAVAGP